MPYPIQTDAEPNGRANLATLVRDMERWGPQAAVVEHKGVRRYGTSYGELARLSRRFAAELERRGVGPGERVVLWGANSAEWIAAFFGCVLRGVLPVPLDAAGGAEFAERIVREVAPRLVVGDRELLARLAGRQGLALEDLDGALPREPGRLEAALTPDSPLQILFTSGTTGEPKGVVQTHRNLLASLGPIEREIAKYRRFERWVHPLRILHTLPLSHVFGQLMGLWVPPLLGAAVVYESRVTGSRLAELIPGERVNVLAAVPRTLGLLRAQLLSRDSSLAGEIEAAQGEAIGRRWWRFRRVHGALGLRFWAAVCGGATLAEELERFWTTLGFALVQGYGLTETSALVTLNHPFQTARGSLGRPLPGRELRLGANGELEVRGEMVATASWRGGQMVTGEGAGQAGQAGQPDQGGWLATGDLAAFDADGRVRFLGRTGQRLVTAAGLNVYLQDVEQVLERQTELEVAVALALPDGAGGEEPAAVVLARAGRAAAGAAVARANGLMAAHQQVRRWWLWPELELPRTATGKVRRGMVESWAREQARVAGGVVEGEKDGGSEPVVALLASVSTRRGPVEDGARLEEDWGLDSMGRVALAAALEEQLGLPLSDGQASELRTLGDLRALVEGRAGLMPAELAPELGGGSPGGTRERNGLGQSGREEGWGVGREEGREAGREAGQEADLGAGSGADREAGSKTGREPKLGVEPEAGRRAGLGAGRGAGSGTGAGVAAEMAPVRREHAGTAHAGTAQPGRGSRQRGELLRSAPPRYNYPRWPWAWPVAGLRMVFVEAVLRPLVWLLGAPQVRDQPRSAPGLARGPVLVISNHRTAVDVALILYALPFAMRRRMAVAMSGEMLAGWQQSWRPGPLPDALQEHRRWWGPPAAFLLKVLFNVFPLPRLSGFRGSFAHAGRALDRGYSVLIFPEGRRSPEERTAPFKPGLGILALEAMVPVLPVALSIAAETDRHWFRSRPGVNIGLPVPIESGGAPEQLTERLRASVEGLLGPRAAS